LGRQSRAQRFDIDPKLDMQPNTFLQKVKRLPIIFPTGDRVSQANAF
jgi:hypothetical protein